MSALTSRLYVIAWLALAAVALGYFVFLFQSAQNPVRTAISNSIFSQSPLSHKSIELADPAVSQALTRMTTEIEILKSALEAARKENSALSAHVRTLESAFGPSTGSLPPSRQEPASPVKDDNLAKNNPKVVSVTTSAMPLDGFSEEVETTPLPVARPAKSTQTLFAVEIASDLTADTVEARWKDVRKRHASLLSKFEPRKVRISAEGNSKQTYKLVVGPFDNAASAALMCARLSIAGLNCSGTTFSGTPLGSVAGR